mmetsp:Transcript_98347/g.275370  ORF Transcript_98347/g.275370 Transcript_98347/m.275370 type:complete len:185 (+) Transcript_98347:243-797(+)
MATESSSTTGAASLHSRYPITSSWELTLHGGEVVKGQVYCTDPTASIVVLQDPTVNDIRMVSVASIQESKRIQEATKSQAELTATEISHTKKALEEREKRAIKLAQESLRHLNPKASAKGQMIFDRLLKACNEVVWKNESIIVLHTIQVDPPYEQENCKLLKGVSAQGSLDRVQKIVAAASSVN